nr:MAG TPA: hypothetical protein [Caudoviricetes sp.]
MLFVRFLSHMVRQHRDKNLAFYSLVKMFISYTKHPFVSILTRTFVCIFSNLLKITIFVFPSPQTILFSLYFYPASLM